MDLPDEIIMLILKDFSSIEILRLKLVSKSFCEFIDRNYGGKPIDKRRFKETILSGSLFDLILSDFPKYDWVNVLKVVSMKGDIDMALYCNYKIGKPTKFIRIASSYGQINFVNYFFVDDYDEAFLGYCEGGYLEQVEKLINNGSYLYNVDIMDEGKHLAFARNKFDVFDYLCNRIYNNQVRGLFLKTCENGSMEQIKHLVQNYRSKISIKDGLYYARCNGRKNVIKYLMDNS